MSTATLPSTALASPWARRYVRTTVGVFSLAFLFAFEALAVAAVMPAVAADLDGLQWYPVAFAAPIAASVVALVVATPAIERRGPLPAVAVGLVLFCAGLVIAGLAPAMPLFLAGRLVHGLGGGVVGVALYVLVAQAYPQSLHPRVFALLTAAWVLPALVGPVVAASVAHAVGWRWVFLGVPAIAIAAWFCVRDAPSRPTGTSGELVNQPTGTSGKLASRPTATSDEPASRPTGTPVAARLGSALVAGAGVLAVSVGGQRVVAAWPLLVIAGVTAVVLAGRRLLPPGSWSARPGLPSVLGTRAGVGTAFAAAEVYVPLLLTLTRGLSLAQAGWVLTTGAVTWCAGAFAAARIGWLRDEALRVRLGVTLVAIGVGGFITVAVPSVPMVVPVLCWAVGGLGIGMAFSTLSVLTLASAPPGAEAQASSALQLNDYLVQSTMLAIGSVFFASFAGHDPITGAVVLVGAAALFGLLALVPATRLRPLPLSQS
jgi:MFS family permease